MRLLPILSLSTVLLLSPLVLSAQEAPPSLATLHLADGTTVALLEWRLSYEFASWRKNDQISNAKSETTNGHSLLLGKKSYPLSGEILSVTHQEDGDSFRVAAISLKKAGPVKIESPDKRAIAPNLDKDYIYQPRSLDISGKTFSGIDRSFCIVSFSALVDCGRTETTRVVQIDFN
ncbi:MAG: hypothetical protein JJE39_02500 [Vicinamibacteria bacterium]|nr:hypothetical protein [Vicinamibacteria bacterium]